MSSTSNKSITEKNMTCMTIPAAASHKIRKNNEPIPLLLPGPAIRHHPKSGINGIVDAASMLFTIMGNLKSLKTYGQLQKLQTRLIKEVNIFYEMIKNQKYSTEYIVVARYVLCATLDDIILSTSWGKRGKWEKYALLCVYNQDAQPHDKFFSIMERAIKEPAIYIDLMELIYLCLGLGYKGQYAKRYDQLEQITNQLYKHIRAWRGHFSKKLSLADFSSTKKTVEQKLSLFQVFLSTACLILTIFIALGYTMDIITNDTYQNLATMEKLALTETAG